MGIPIPRRSLRSIAVLTLLSFGAYIFWRQLDELYPSGDAASGRAATPVRGDVHEGPTNARVERERDLVPVPPRHTKPAVKGGADRGLVLQDEVMPPLDLDTGRAGGSSGSGGGAGMPARNAGKAFKLAGKGGKKATPEHTYLANGLVVPDARGQHPVYDLLERGQAAWTAKLARSSKTLREAVDEYRKRYGRAPPLGFDRWFAWAKAHGVQLLDEYDQINRDLEPFWALTPTELRALRREASDMSGMYTLSCPGNSKKGRAGTSARCTYKIQEKGLNQEGRTVAKERAEAQLALLQQIEDELEEVEAVFYSHDVPWQFVGHEYKSALEDAASVGEYYNVEEHQLDTAHLGWASACAPHKPLRQDYNISVLPDLDAIWDGDKSFIWDHKAAMDPCLHPTMAHLVGFLSSHGKGPGPTKAIYPVMAMCKTLLHSDVLAVSEEAWTEDVGEDPAWDDKRESRLLWRGKNTGIYFSDEVPWNISQRVNLVEHSARGKGSVPVYSVSSPDKPVGQPAPQPWSSLNAKLVDVGFVDEAIQCDPDICKLVQKEYTFASRKTWAEGNDYKYLLDLDGNGWSARFKRLMSTNSLVLKSTIFPEWYTDRIQPWVHYVPIKADLTDLYDVLTFFTDGHDALAKEIATAGKQWSHTFWRKDDMIAYQFRLFLEMSRLMAPDRDKASFTLRGRDLAGSE